MGNGLTDEEKKEIDEILANKGEYEEYPEDKITHVHKIEDGEWRAWSSWSETFEVGDISAVHTSGWRVHASTNRPYSEEDVRGFIEWAKKAKEKNWL